MGSVFQVAKLLGKIGLGGWSRAYGRYCARAPRIATWMHGMIPGTFSLCWQLSQCWGLVEIWWNWGVVLRCKVKWKLDNSDDMLWQQPSLPTMYHHRITSFTWNSLEIEWTGAFVSRSPCREFNIPPWPGNPGQRWQRDALCRWHRKLWLNGTSMMPNASKCNRFNRSIDNFR